MPISIIIQSYIKSMSCPGKFIGTIAGNKYYKSNSILRPYCYVTKGGKAYSTSRATFMYSRAKYKAWKVPASLSPSQKKRSKTKRKKSRKAKSSRRRSRRSRR